MNVALKNLGVVGLGAKGMDRLSPAAILDNPPKTNGQLQAQALPWHRDSLPP